MCCLCRRRSCCEVPRSVQCSAGLGPLQVGIVLSRILGTTEVQMPGGKISRLAMRGGRRMQRRVENAKSGGNCSHLGRHRVACGSPGGGRCPSLSACWAVENCKVGRKLLPSGETQGGMRESRRWALPSALGVLGAARCAAQMCRPSKREKRALRARRRRSRKHSESICP